ncbi:MAG: response regulator, partial [Pseudomonadota bacterium]
KVKMVRKPKSRIGELTGTKILCVDNEPAILEGMASLLEQWGCDVLTATTPNAAMELFNSGDQPPDILLIDYHLDRSTGIAFFEEIRNSSLHSPRGILITADRTEEVKQEAANCGLQLINKPVRPAVLRAMISQSKRTAIAAE